MTWAAISHTLVCPHACTVATATQTYLFDILVLGELAFQSGLRALLESPACVKVMHDCRKDSAALFHQHHVRLQNVFDSQVADLFIRRAFTGVMPGYVKGPLSLDAPKARQLSTFKAAHTRASSRTLFVACTHPRLRVRQLPAVVPQHRRGGAAGQDGREGVHG